MCSRLYLKSCCRLFQALFCLLANFVDANSWCMMQCVMMGFTCKIFIVRTHAWVDALSKQQWLKLVGSIAIEWSKSSNIMSRYYPVILKGVIRGIHMRWRVCVCVCVWGGGLFLRGNPTREAHQQFWGDIAQTIAISACCCYCANCKPTLWWRRAQ